MIQICYVEHPNGEIIKADPEHFFIKEIVEHNALILHTFDIDSPDHTLFLLKNSSRIENYWLE